MDISLNVQNVYEKIASICAKYGRNPSDVTVLAATKTVAPNIINRLIDLKLDTIGENRVQELLSKYDSLDKRFNIHFIGHLQTNKVRDVVNRVSLIHSVDSFRLIDKIDETSSSLQKVTNILLEVNVFEDDDKYGFKMDEVNAVMEYCQNLTHTKVCGLMTIAAIGCTPQTYRQKFSALREKLYYCNDVYGTRMNVLSMGMSDDYEFAIAEGATLIRLGSAIFKEKN